jgi:peroxiredoxin
MIALLFKASLVLIVLLTFYKLFLEKESFFAANRIYLLGCLFLAIILPFISLPRLIEHQGVIATILQPSKSEAGVSIKNAIPQEENDRTTPESTASAPKNTTSYPTKNSTSTANTPTALQQIQAVEPLASTPAKARGVTHWLMLLYYFGVAILTLKLLSQVILTVWKIYRTTDKIADAGTVLVNINGDIDPCSFFHYIFINPAGYDYETYEQIIAHEQIHVRKWHSLDLLLSEMAVIVLWFNPFVWLLRREVEKNIEFQTDAIMLRENAAAKESYQLNLLKISTYTEPLSITTNYNQSLIKKRILKMNARRSNPYGYLKYAFVLPVLFGLSLLLNEPTRGSDQIPTGFTMPTIDTSDAELLKVNQFSAIQDTAVLKTKKQPGYGKFSGGFGYLYQKAIPENDERRQFIPPDITDPEIGEESIDLKVGQYQRLVADQHEYVGAFLQKWYPAKIDTANLPSLHENTLQVVVGKKDGERVYIVDQNNNQDFRDDPVRHLKKINWKAMEEPVSCHYGIYNGEAIIRDSSWVYIGILSNGKVGISAAQHLVSTFAIDEQQYTVSVFNPAPSTRWCFEDAQISIIARNGIDVDSLTFSDKFELGEYLKFGQYYYQFADIKNDGSAITLIRDKDIRDNFGTQSDLIAPDFSAVTTDGDAIALRDFRGRYLLLVNMDRCYSTEMTNGNYQKIQDSYSDKIEIVGIEYSSDDLQAKMDRYHPEGPFVISTENPTIQQYYRDFHCSKVCFLIDPAGRIIERFEIEDWKNTLARHFN